MVRKAIERSNKNYYHITARSNNREYFYLPQEIVWNIFMNELDILQSKYRIKIPAFVMMSNHFHLLVLTPDENIDKIMYFFMKRTTLEIQRLSGRINKIYGGRYKGSIIKNFSYLVNVYKYIYLNPVKAKITSKAEFYPYSTLYFKYNSSLKLPIKIEDILPKHAFQNYDNLDELKWINLTFNDTEYDSIKTGLKKSIFDYAKDRASGKRIIPKVNHPKKKTQEELWEEMFPAENQSILITNAPFT